MNIPVVGPHIEPPHFRRRLADRRYRPVWNIALFLRRRTRRQIVAYTPPVIPPVDRFEQLVGAAIKRKRIVMRNNIRRHPVIPQPGLILAGFGPDAFVLTLPHVPSLEPAELILIIKGIFVRFNSIGPALVILFVTGLMGSESIL